MEAKKKPARVSPGLVQANRRIEELLAHKAGESDRMKSVVASLQEVHQGEVAALEERKNAVIGHLDEQLQRHRRELRWARRDREALQREIDRMDRMDSLPMQATDGAARRAFLSASEVGGVVAAEGC